MLHDFKNGLGPAPAHHHKNSNGSLGGWVAETAYVAPTAYVGENAKVYGHAQVYDQAMIHGFAQIFGQAKIFGQAQVYSQAWVCGKAWVYDQAQVYDQAYIRGQAQVFNNVHINKKMHIDMITKIESQDDVIYGEMKFEGKLLPYTIYQDVENVIWIWFAGWCKTLEEWKSHKSWSLVHQQFVKFLDSVN